MSERMNPAQVNSVMGLDPRSNSENKYLKLHAMGFGELLDTTLSLYRKHFWSFLRIVSVYFIAMLIGVLIQFFLMIRQAAWGR